MKLAHGGALGAAGAVVALAWWAVLPTSGGAAPPVQPAARVAVAVSPAVTVARSSVAPAVAEPPPAALPMVPVRLTGPERLQVGEQAELRIAVGGSAHVGDVAFTLRFDPNVLQARAGAPGDWATGDGVDTRFSVEIPEAADQAQLRAAPASRPWSAAGGTVALVQLEAVGPGTTAVALVDVVVTDTGGRRLPVLLSMARLQVTADPAPLPP